MCFAKFAFAQRLDRNVKFISFAYPFVVNYFTVCYMAIYGCLSSHEVKKPISLSAIVRADLKSNIYLLSAFAYGAYLRLNSNTKLSKVFAHIS